MKLPQNAGRSQSANHINTGVARIKLDLAEKYHALKQPVQAAKFRAEAAALDKKAAESAKK